MSAIVHTYVADLFWSIKCTLCKSNLSSSIFVNFFRPGTITFKLNGTKMALKDGWSKTDNGENVSTTNFNMLSSNSACLYPPFLALFDLWSFSNKYWSYWGRCFFFKWLRKLDVTLTDPRMFLWQIWQTDTTPLAALWCFVSEIYIIIRNNYYFCS